MAKHANRRQFLERTLAIAGLGLLVGRVSADTEDKWPQLSLSKQQWKQRLPADAYAVLFEEATERPHSSPLNKEKRDGQYICAACHLPLFKSKWKYDSGTGWPSFYDADKDHLGFKTDYKAFYPRKEYHCARCGGHQGHVFKDGPRPTGLRYCNNGLALKFVPDGEALPALVS